MKSTRNSKKAFEVLFLSVVFALACGSANAANRYVPSQYSTIQAAINACNNGDTVVIADGIYNGDGNRDIDFDGKAITVRSQNGPDNCIIDCQGTETEPHRGFYFHSGEGSNSVLDGVKIMNAYAGGSGLNSRGGGIYCLGSSPRINNCILIHNRTGTNTQGGGGGGMFNDGACAPTVTNCTFEMNSTEGFGGGVANNSGDVTLINCQFIGNSAPWGGAIASDESLPTLTNCLLIENSAEQGGAIFSGGGSNPNINNCTFLANMATQKGGCICNDFFGFGELTKTLSQS